MLLDGTGGQRMLDNITIDRRGRLILQEDTGNEAHVAKLWQYDVERDALNLIAQHDPERFAPGAPAFLTQDEESSGVIDASTILGEGWFLLDVQAHYATGAELVEGVSSSLFTCRPAASTERALDSMLDIEQEIRRSRDPF